MRRIAVIGNGAGGKTTLARALGVRLGIPHREVDAVQFRSDWSRVPAAATARVLDAWLADDAWVIDGFGPLACVRRRLAAADTIVWIDLPLHTHLRRALHRRDGPPLRVTLTSILRVHVRFRPRWDAELVTNRHKLVRLRSPDAVRRWLEDAGPEGGGDELDREPAGRVLAVEDRVDLDDVQRVQQA
jgi:adenylate kinase family enzyme